MIHRLCFTFAALLLVGIVGPIAADEPNAYDVFDRFVREHFGAEKEELVYATFGKTLSFDQTGTWGHISSESACAGFETVLPGKCSVQFGPTTAYGRTTSSGDRYTYLHLVYLTGLQQNQTYHYQVTAEDERGNKVKTPDSTLTTSAAKAVLHVPGDVQGPTYILDQPGSTYVVTKDLTIAGRAFEIKASNVTLDLGGHTIVYDNAHMGALSSDPGDFWAYINKSAFGVMARGASAKILNGTIKQGAGNDGAQVNAIGFNPIYLGAENIEVAGVTLDYSGAQMTGLTTHGAESGNLHHNVIIDRSTEITNRHQGCDGISRASHGFVHHNLLMRVRQRGLGGNEVFHNEIYCDSFATNSSAICPVNNGKYYGNRVFGTGYHCVGITWANGITVNNNFIHTQGNKPNKRSAEYGDQDSGNGVRLTEYATEHVPYENVLYHDNVIVVRGKYGCQARGVQFFSDPYVKNLVFRNNVVKALVDDQETKQVACVVTQGNAARSAEMLPILYQDNMFISNVLNVRFGDYYGVGSNHRFVRCKFVKLGDDSRYKTFYYDSDLPCVKHILLDCTFEGGASLDNIGYAVDKAPFDMTIAWTLSITTAPGAELTATDKSAIVQFHGTADDKGHATMELPEYIQKQAGKTFMSPYVIIASHNGKRASAKVTLSKPQSVQLPL